MGLYKTILADPPWMELGGGKTCRGANAHYDLMTIEQIVSLPIEGLVNPEGCHLYLWVTNGFLQSGLDVMKAWGFRYVTKIDWVKFNTVMQFGIGQYFRGSSESCLFGVMGKLPYKKDKNGKRMQGRTAIVAPRREHSRKPDELRKMAEIVSWEPRIELFARDQIDGWDRWGKEVESTVSIDTCI